MSPYPSSFQPVWYTRKKSKAHFWSRSHEKELFVEFLGWFPSPEYMHLVLEYCPFGDISQQPRPVSELKARSVCCQLMKGLAVLHNLDITHRDVKPEASMHGEEVATGH